MFRNIGGSLPVSLARYQIEDASVASSIQAQSVATPGASELVPAVSGAVTIDMSTTDTPTTNTSELPDSDDVMRLVYANNLHPTLYRDVWGEIAKFSSRDVLLNLRSAAKHMAAWVDRGITSIKVSATDAPAMLAMLGDAIHLKHIDAFRIEDCNDQNFPSVVTALAALSDRPFALTVVESRRRDARLTQASLQLLTEVAATSLEIWLGEEFSHVEAEALAHLDYPVSVQGTFVADAPRDQLALAGIPRLTALSMWPHLVDTDGARAFATHPTLTELRCLSTGRLSLSEAALSALAGSVQLRTLYIGSTRHSFGAEAFSALANNRILERLKIGNVARPIDPIFAELLSTNTTLKSLDIPVGAGCGYLTKMPALEDLTLRCTSLNLDDAQLILQHAQLHRLAFVFLPHFDAGTLGTIAGSDVIALRIERVAPSEDDVTALLANGHLRSLDLDLTSDFAETVAYALALATHPTLTTLTLNYVKKPHEAPEVNMLMTTEERSMMMAAWGNHRPAGALMVNF